MTAESPMPLDPQNRAQIRDRELRVWDLLVGWWRGSPEPKRQCSRSRTGSPSKNWLRALGPRRSPDGSTGTVSERQPLRADPASSGGVAPNAWACRSCAQSFLSSAVTRKVTAHASSAQCPVRPAVTHAADRRPSANLGTSKRFSAGRLAKQQPFALLAA